MAPKTPMPYEAAIREALAAATARGDVPASSRMPAHGSGPMWSAIPSSQWTCTTYSLPVSRRTRVKTQNHQVLGGRFTPPEVPRGLYKAF
jgi:hypothetical protein